MTACCVLGHSDSPETAAGRSQMQYPYPYHSWCCFVVFFGLNSVHPDDPNNVGDQSGWVTFQRCTPLPLLLWFCPVDYTTVCTCCMFYRIRTILLRRLTTSGVFTCHSETTLTLGLLFKHDYCIVRVGPGRSIPYPWSNFLTENIADVIFGVTFVTFNVI